MRALKILLAAAVLYSGIYFLMAIPGALSQDSYDTTEWRELWNCRCDSCCERLNRIDAESRRIDAGEGARI